MLDGGEACWYLYFLIWKWLVVKPIRHANEGGSPGSSSGRTTQNIGQRSPVVSLSDFQRGFIPSDSFRQITTYEIFMPTAND